MELVFNYKNNDTLRKSFNDLAQKTFGISFEEWYEKGLWENKYECYSIVEEDKIISNLSVNKLKFLIDGKEKTALQIGTVMTDEKERNMGLSKKLMEFVLEKFEKEYDIIYLFANDTVLDFYPKFGFRKMNQKQISISEKIEKNSIYNFRKLHMDSLDDLVILKKSGTNRIPNARNFDVINGYEILFWYCLNVFRDNIYFDEKNEVLVIYSYDGDALNIHDIVLGKKQDYKKIIGSIIGEDTKVINLDFNLETDNIEIVEKVVEDDDNSLFVKGELDENISFIHPVTSHA